MSRLAVITFLAGPGGPDIDNTLPGGPVYPGQGLPSHPVDPGYGHPGYGGGHPGHALPGGGHISLLPVFPFDPTIPSNELPGEQPEAGNELPIRPGARFVVKWLCGSGLILVPDNELPAGRPNRPSQGLPETPATKPVPK